MSEALDKLAVPPVFTERMGDYYREVESFQRSAARSAKRTLRVSLGLNLALFVILCLLTGAMVYALPLIRVVPVFLYARPDGTTEAAVTPGSLPPSLSEAQQLAAVWEFVRLYEGYSQAESQYNWNVVSAMSEKRVRDVYQADRDPKNKASPINALGDRVVVHVDFISMQPACESCANRYNVRFVRTIRAFGDPRIQRSTWTATVQWTTDLASRINFKERITFNAPGIIVTDYPGAQRDDVPQ